MQAVDKAYELAKESYKAFGVDVDAAMAKLSQTAISIHCWQGDDVVGFESDRALSGGIQSTGNYPGKAHTPEQLRADLDKALSLIPGKHRLNLHAIYAENIAKGVGRDQLTVENFRNWIEWAKAKGIGLDFNPSMFSHPMADDNLTLSHPDGKVRQFWIDHCKACRRIAAAMGRELNNPVVNNIWIPDGYKDVPADRMAPRRRLEESLDEIFKEEFSKDELRDAVECKLFGIGSESYVVGSHEFYMGYGLTRGKMLCLDAGHFHPTETISDKISSILCFQDEVLLHVSRGVRWDSDHVILFNDDLVAIAQEIVRNDALNRVHIGLDYFDASINRIAAWVIGSRNMLKALLFAMLEPSKKMQSMENDWDFAGRMAMMEEAKMLPFAAVWNYYCQKNNVPVGFDFMEEIRTYEKNVLAKR